jgi:carboxylesterase
VKSTLAKINQTIWELHRELKRRPDNAVLKRDLVKFFHESRHYAERRDGIPEQQRSFLLLQQRESICCLLIHGAGGSPSEMRGLGEYLFQQGFSVYAMRLPLEITPDASARRPAAAQAWWLYHRGRKDGIEVNRWNVSLSESEIVLDTLLAYNPSTYVIGYSFGGTIALNLLGTYAPRGTILISPALYAVRSGRYLLFQFVRKLLPPAARSVAPREDTVLDLVERTRMRFRAIESPICVVQAADDPLVSPKGFAFLESRSRNPKSRFHLLPRGGHLLVSGEERQKVFEICGDFIREV